MADRPRREVPAVERVRWAPVEGSASLFTPDFCDYLVRLHDEFTPRVRALLARRAAVLRRALDERVLPAAPQRRGTRRRKGSRTPWSS